MKLEVVRHVDMDEALRGQLFAWLDGEFGDYTNACLNTVADWHVLAWEGDTLVGHVDITDRLAQVGGHPLRLGGVGGVVTLKEWRKCGIASAAMRRTDAFLHELAVPFGLLICDPAMTPFYGKLGWREVSGPLVYDQLDPVNRGLAHKVTLDGAAMILPCLEQN